MNNLIKVKNHIFLIIFFLLFCLLYKDVFSVWYGGWVDTDSFYAASVFVFIFIGYFIKTNMEEIINIEKQPNNAGIAVIIFGLILYVVGTRGDIINATSLSLPVFIAGIILTNYGFKLLKFFMIPLLLLFFTLPVVPMDRITLPLQLMSANLSSRIISFLGVPSMNEGNVMMVGNYQFSIVPGCSGLKSLTTLFFASILYGHFIQAAKIKKILLVAFSIPLALLMNTLRIVVVGFYALYNGTQHVEKFHDNAGIVIFILSLGILTLITNLIKDKEANFEDEV